MFLIAALHGTSLFRWNQERPSNIHFTASHSQFYTILLSRLLFYSFSISEFYELDLGKIILTLLAIINVYYS